MTDWNAVNAFMAQVVPWPGSEEPGYVNLHYSMVNARKPNDPLLKGMGWPFRDLSTLVGRAAWINGTTNFKDVWFCTSLQSTMRNNTRGKPKAHRLAANALKLKAIWIDMDVGPNDPKKYPTIEEALKTAIWFREKVGLPPFSAIVGSGGGIHVYWISDAALTPAEWRAYAWGLKALLVAEGIRCDAGLTTDAARLLRVPGTFNHKTNPPRPVQLFNVPLVTYNFATALSFLTTITSEQGTSPSPLTKSTLFADGADINSFKKPPAIKVDGPDLQAGIEKHVGDGLLKAEPILKQCGFLRDALMTGGKSYDNPLWNLSVLCSTFMENGNAISHALSQGHATYSAADTQALYDRKVADRADRNIGYPSCATIQGAGCQSCATCPLLAKGKSPLNIRPVVTATVTPPGASHGTNSYIPDGFDLNDKGIVCKVVETDDSGEVSTTMVPLFQCIMTDFWLQKNPGEHLNFTMTVDKGFTEQTSVDLGEVSAQGFPAYLGKRRVLIDVRGERYLKEFFLSTIGKLRALAAAQQSVPFGWYEDADGKVRGFSYAGTVFMDDGTERPCGAADPVVRQNYTPKGDIAEWFKAAKTVTDRKRPELSTIMLMAFASPLIALNGKNTAVLSAFGKDSGAGKSSAYRVGMSVWGHPIGTKVTERQTANSITGVMRLIRHLPFYWDEITNDKDRIKFKTVMHELDGGKEKGRMLDGTRHQEVGMFQLMIHYASNGSLLEFLRQDNQNTVASQMRVLEWEVKRINGGAGFLPDADAEMLLAATNRNYGRMGELYAKFLAVNHVAIAEEFRLKCNEVQTALHGGQSERYWYTTVAIMTLAAKYAKQLGVDVEPADIEAFMCRVYHDNVVNRDEFNHGGDVDNAETVLTRYLKERDAQQRAVWTNYMHNKRGKPPKPVIILKGIGHERNNLGGIEVRFAVETKICVIAQTDFTKWLREHKHSETQIWSSLKTVYSAERQKLQICSGWVHDPGREDCIVLKIEPNTPLWGYLTTWTPPEEKSKLEAEEEIEPVDTGLSPVDNVVAFLPVDANGLTTPDAARAFVNGAKRG